MQKGEPLRFDKAVASALDQQSERPWKNGFQARKDIAASHSHASSCSGDSFANRAAGPTRLPQPCTNSKRKL